MSNTSVRLTLFIFSLFAFLPSWAGAQTYVTSPGLSTTYAQPSAFSREQLSQLLAPIALYPDPIVAQILMAATYPVEVVEASRWLNSGNNAYLRDYQLSAALQYQPWDPSVKSLISFPPVLRMMDGNLQWTEQLGDAFLGQQAEVMDTIQYLRRQAYASGALRSSPQQTVTIQGGVILIEPAQPDVVYVPVYNPSVVYGRWQYPDYPPYYFTPSYVYGRTPIHYGVAIVFVRDLIFHRHIDFHRRRIHIDDDHYKRLNRGKPPVRSGYWEHDSTHRRSAPYRSHTGTREARESDSSVTIDATSARRQFRGFDTDEVVRDRQTRTRDTSSSGRDGARRETRARIGTVPTEVQSQPVVVAPAREQVRAPSIERIPQPQVSRERLRSQRGPSIRSETPRTRVLQGGDRRPTPPVFESQTSTPDARIQSQRGKSSRFSMEPVRTDTRSDREMRVRRDDRGDRSGRGSGGSRGERSRSSEDESTEERRHRR